jgi:phage gp46-like protein
MDKKIDIKMRLNSDDYYDFSIKNGDFEMVEGFDTAIQMSIFCERRASESEIKIPEKRRGYWGNECLEVIGFENGSKLWLLSQCRLTNETLNKAIDYTQSCLKWLVDDGYLDKVVVGGNLISGTTAILNIDLYRANNIVFSKGYDIWQRTFTDGEL